MELNLPASSLDLEITESVVMEDPKSAVVTLQQLREMGVGLKMDDFGTGYSSLSCVHRFSLTGLKIDRSFVANMGDDSNHRAVVKAIIAMGHALQLKLVAEGVETDDHAKALREMGCELAQGYFFAKPLSPVDAEKFLVAESMKLKAA
jgi:EAL domain-containing protein (putative c-di-GMP-specific phosphodiesterase class I)